MKKYFDKDFLIVVIINILIPVTYAFLGLHALLLMFLPELFTNEYFITSESSTLYNIGMIIGFIVAFGICSTRLLILPVFYSKFEKYSKSKLVQIFISNLKSNCKYQVLTLFIVELPLILYFLLTVDSIGLERFIECLYYLLFAFVCFDLLGCYVVLFLWWKIKI